MTRRVGVWAFLVALTATTATVPPGWSEEPPRGAPRQTQAPTAEELAAAREARFRTVWSAADAPHQAGDYAESERLYKQVLAEFPDAQRAALRVAIAQERQGKSAEALESYQPVGPIGLLHDIRVSISVLSAGMRRLCDF